MWAAAVLAGLAALAWLVRGARLPNLLLTLGYASLAVLVFFLGHSASGGYSAEELRMLARLAIPMSGIGLAFSMTFARARPRMEIISQRGVLLAWSIAGGVAWWATYRADFVVPWTPLDGEPVLVLGGPAIWSMVGHLLVAVAMSMYIETTYRAAKPDSRKLLATGLVGFYAFLGYLALCLSISLLFSIFYAPLWLAASVPVILTSSLGFATGLNRHLSDTRISAARPVVRSSFSLFGAGLYVMFIGLAGEVAKLTGQRFTTVAVLSLVGIACLGLLLFYLSNRAQKKIHAFVDRNFLLSHYDYRHQWDEVCRRLRPDLRLPGLLAASSEAFQDIFSVRNVSIFLRRRTGRVLDMAYCTKPGEGIGCGMDEPLTRHLLRTRQALQLSRRPDDFESVPVWVENHDVLERTGAQVWCALVSGDEMVGMVGLGDRLNDLRFTYEDLDYLETLCLHIGNAAWGARLAEEWSLDRERDTVRKLAGFVIHDLQDLKGGPGMASRGGNGTGFASGAAAPVSIEEMERSWSRLLDTPGAARQRCGLNELVEESLREFEADEQEDRGTVPIRVELGTDVPEVSVDAPRFREVIRTLLRNALESSPAGSEVTLKTRVVLSHGGQGRATGAVVSISDSGGGMTPEFRDSLLFRPFVTTKSDSLGVGLFQSRAVVEAHGGALRASGAAGRGTTFEVELPVTGEGPSAPTAGTI